MEAAGVWRSSVKAALLRANRNIITRRTRGRKEMKQERALARQSRNRRHPGSPERLHRCVARRGFSRRRMTMTEETATNPVEGEDNVSATLPDTQEVDTQGQGEQALDDDGNPLDPADDGEEIEHDGRKYLVPK